MLPPRRALAPRLRLWLILALAALVWGSLPAQASNNRDKVWRLKKSACEKDACAHLLPEEAHNCVNLCTSPACFNQTYGAEPLEDGEIDNLRSRAFVTCLREETKQDKKRKLTSA